jgi:hypothetical protein
MRREIVNRLLNSVAFTERLNVSDEERLIEGSRCVEVYPAPFSRGEGAQILVIVV